MPELPEVETVRKTLEVQLGNPIITDVEIRYQPLVSNVTPAVFRAQLLGKQIKAYDRIGKYLIFDLDDVYLISHLRMEGKYFVAAATEPFDQKHTHGILRFQDGRELRYHDTRKFGKMYLYPKTEVLEQQKAFVNIGYDVFDERLTSMYLYEKLHSRKIVLKQALLDQSVMAGVGNIYADEICFALGYHPETKIYHLKKLDYERLLKETRRILGGAIRAGGTTIRSYTSSLGVDGRFQLELKVHARKGETCPRCGTTILKKVVATRGTYYCPSCQRKGKAKVKRSKCIGLTGVMGVGKSSVIKILERYQIPVLDCDKINAQLLCKDADGYKQIKERFPSTIFNECDEIDHQKLSDLIFHDPSRKAELEGILHPLIKRDIKQSIATLKNHSLIVVEVPLLFEVHWEAFFDEIWVVACQEEILLQRLKEYRGVSEQEAKRRLAHQMSQAEKIKRADVVLMNDQDLHHLEEQIQQAIQGDKKG